MTGREWPSPESVAEARRVAVRLMADREITPADVADAMTGRTRRSAPVDARTREGKAWRLASVSASSALRELQYEGRAVRVLMHRNVLTMSIKDAEHLLAFVTESLAYAREMAAGDGPPGEAITEEEQA